MADRGVRIVTAPYYDDGTVQLYLGDMREIIPELGLTADLIVTDPPYEETSLAWDRWPLGWPGDVAEAAHSMWCFGSMRILLDRCNEFAGWKLSQDIIWEKPHGSGIANDRFRRVHEHILHWYRGPWANVHHNPPRTPYTGPDSRHGYTRTGADGHTGALAEGYRWTENGTRLMRSVIDAPTMWRRGAIHPTEKPVEILRPLIEYGCPDGGLVLDPFAGSGSTLEAARLTGHRAIGIEISEAYCEAAARRLSQQTIGAAS
jgi:site-specific DNA-methyltransferase (adenine-specific)